MTAGYKIIDVRESREVVRVALLEPPYVATDLASARVISEEATRLILRRGARGDGERAATLAALATIWLCRTAWHEG